MNISTMLLQGKSPMCFFCCTMVIKKNNIHDLLVFIVFDVFVVLLLVLDQTCNQWPSILKARARPAIVQHCLLFVLDFRMQISKMSFQSKSPVLFFSFRRDQKTIFRICFGLSLLVFFICFC